MSNNIWLKRVLVPFWTIELAWLGFFLIIVAIGLETQRVDFGVNSLIETKFTIALCASTIIQDILMIVLFKQHKLTPTKYLIFQCIKTASWTAVVVTQIVIDMTERFRAISPVLMTIYTVVLCSLWGQLVYGSVIFHFQRTGKVPQRGQYAGVESSPALAHDDYPPPGSYAAYNPNNIAPVQPSQSTHREPLSVPSSTSTLQHPTAMHPALRPKGAPAEYYDASATQYSYELQGTAREDR